MRGVLKKGNVDADVVRTCIYGRRNPLLNERWRIETRPVDSGLVVIVDVSITFSSLVQLLIGKYI